MTGIAWDDADDDGAPRWAQLPIPDGSCPICDGTGVVEEYVSWGEGDDTWTTSYCQCGTGQDMLRDYEADQVMREELEREG
jgi:hypothetical protein